MRVWLRPRSLVAVAAAVALAAAVAAGLLLAAPGGSSDEGRESRPAPTLTGEVLVPPPIRLTDLRGKPVLVNFWASWCVPCREEAPRLARFAREMDSRARLVGVDFQDAKSDALAFVREFRWTFPNVRDPRGRIAARYGLSGLPTTYVIDSKGRIARSLTGAQTYESLVRAIAEVE